MPTYSVGVTINGVNYDLSSGNVGVSSGNYDIDISSGSIRISSGNMQSYTPIPPPRLPPPRSALQDVTARANQSPVTLPPVKKPSASTKGRVQTRDELDALSSRGAYKQTAVDVRRPAPGPVRFPGGPLVYPDLTKEAWLASKSANQAPVAAPTAAPAAPASSSRKRKAEAPASSDEAIAAYRQDLDEYDVSDMPADRDCTEVRALIQKVIDRGIFKKGEFCKAIGCSPTSLNRFLAKTGRDGGIESDVYIDAWAWFKQRELAGLSMPAASAATQKKAKTAKARVDSTSAGLDNIQLYGEETDSVPVYETCDVVRRKITAHLKTPGLTQAQFCRDLHAQLKAPGCKAIQSKMLADFRKKKGPRAGCTSSVYYAAYVYFEKRRLAERKPKSKHRLEMEDIYPGGADRERDGRHGVWCRPGERPYEDEYGRLHFL